MSENFFVLWLKFMFSYIFLSTLRAVVINLKGYFKTKLNFDYFYNY
jgi:hypothetical protein